MSANASKGKIIRLEDVRKERLLRAGPPPFDPQAIAQRINRVRTAPTADERELALSLVLRDAEEMLRLLGIMGGEIGAFRQQIRSLAQQSADAATINSVLLASVGGEVRVDRQWFIDYEVTGGFQVEETETEVIIRLVGVDHPTGEGVPSVSASQQTEEP